MTDFHRIRKIIVNLLPGHCSVRNVRTCPNRFRPDTQEKHPCDPHLFPLLLLFCLTTPWSFAPMIAQAPKPKAEAGQPTAAVVMSGQDDYRPTNDTAFDIETGPSGKGEGSLLDPLESRVVAIGYYEVCRDVYLIAYDLDEAAMLRQFWGAFLSLHGAGAKLLGFNTQGFDLPFLIRRSWHHGVDVPRVVLSNGKYWPDTVVDLMIAWRCGGYKDFISLDNLAKFLGVGAKNGDGELFYLKWNQDRDAAIAYLANDVRLCADCAAKMGFTDDITT